MNDKLSVSRNILSQYHQEHLLMFYDELSLEEKEELLNQILSIPFAELDSLYQNSKIEKSFSISEISPQDYFDVSDLSKDEKLNYIQIGNHVIQNREVAVITLAGGQGTRLGYKGPKGCYELDLCPKKSLFEIISDQFKLACSSYNITIPWYIMTSPSNDFATRSFFKEKDFFQYDPSSVSFFSQSTLPLIDINGKLLLEEPYLIKEASNGNGDIFSSLSRHDMIQDMKNRNVKWILIGGVDNILFKWMDPLFLGMMVSENYKVGAKSIYKEHVLQSDWVFAKVNEKCSIIDCNYLTPEMKLSFNAKGKSQYRDINILSHVFHISALEKLATRDLPYHRAFKKNTFVNEEGMKQVPNEPNSFKFEKFIFDSFSYFDDILLLRVDRNREFAPIKSFTGDFTPETALELYLNYHYS